ncbi:MAG: 1-deoxy-D-xylulose-5-phosphate reductoisomerase [Gammaproteobacteria bacterium]|nr:1-deoxy-D-xylulose-5-phosphate reductoisomerase [Gammaproteobacteria bacterium]
MKRVTLLGATGSIGLSTLDILARHPERFTLHAVTADTSHARMAEICRRFRPAVAVMRDASAAAELRALLEDSETRVLAGAEGLAEVAAEPAVDIVVAAIVGAAGLLPTLAAVQAGKRILLANKETLVMAGDLFMAEVSRHGAELLPVDSEHNAIFQCLPAASLGGIDGAGVDRILLTGSGGPFRDLPLEELGDVTPEQACAHPNWDMGPKISVDSATMMNKGLELIEACWLFGVQQEQIEIVLHRQSIVHSMVSYRDGSVLAQLGNPDMRTPIANALAWPERISSGVEPLDLVAVSQLDFSAADERRYPCLRIAREAWRAGGTGMAVMNAANEVAVEHFLRGGFGFADISDLIETVLASLPPVPAEDLETVLEVDDKARKLARQIIQQRT